MFGGLLAYVIAGSIIGFLLSIIFWMFTGSDGGAIPYMIAVFFPIWLPILGFIFNIVKRIFGKSD